MSSMVLVLGKVWLIMAFLKKFSGPKKGGGVSVSLQLFSYEVLICVING